MGGTALLHLNVQRLSKSKYIDITNEINEIIHQYYEFAFIPLQFPTKESFGDVDILVSNKLKEVDIESKGRVENGNVTSIEYKGAQVDFIYIPQDAFNYSKIIYSWGEFGQILGMCCRCYGLKSSYNGLSLKNPPFYLSNDPKRVFEFLDLDMDTYTTGFANEIECFKYFMTSKYFKCIQMSEKAKYRDTVKNYLAFTKNYQETHTVIIKDIDPIDNHLRKTAIHFFNKEKEFNDNQVELENSVNYSKLVNGNIISTITGYTGKELGSFINQFSLKYSKKDILSKNENEVESLIHSFNNDFIIK